MALFCCEAEERSPLVLRCSLSSGSSFQQLLWDAPAMGAAQGVQHRMCSSIHGAHERCGAVLGQRVPLVRGWETHSNLL